MSEMMRARLVAYEPDGALSEVLRDADLVSWDASFAQNDLGALSVQVPTVADVANLVRGQREIAVQVAVGASWVEPRNGRFVSSEVSSDPSADLDVPTVALKSYSALLDRCQILREAENSGRQYDSDGKRQFYSASPGQIILSVLNESREHYSTLPGLEFDFTTVVDSRNQEWSARTTVSYEPGMTLLDVLSDLTNYGFIDWHFEGRNLVIVNAESAAVHHDVDLHLTDVEEAPVRSTVENLFTHIRVNGKDGKTWIQPVPGATVAHGDRVKVIANDSISTEGTALDLIAQEIARATAPRREYTRSIIAFDIIPLLDYELGDFVLAPDLDGAVEHMRVHELGLVWDAGDITARITLNDRFVDADVRQQKRLKGIVHGANDVAGDGSIPSRSDRAIPAAPQGVIATSQGYWADVTPLSSVNVSWAAVTTDVDGVALNGVESYEVRCGGAVKSTDVLSAGFDQQEPSRHVAVRVRAISETGIVGRWSEPVEVLTQYPNEVLARPTEPQLSSSNGAVSVLWDGRLQGTGVPFLPPKHFSHVLVESRVQLPGESFGGWEKNSQDGGFVSAGLPKGSLFEARFYAVDFLGSESAASTTSSIVVESDVQTALDKADAAALEAADASGKADALEQRQVIIGRTVDGLNRSFTSIESPGRGFLGYENLAPPIVGSDSWAEVRRNYATEGAFTSVGRYDIEPEIVNGDVWYRVTQISDHAERRIFMLTGVNPDVPVGAALEVWNTLDEPMTLRLQMGSSLNDGPSEAFDAGERRRVEAYWPSTAGNQRFNPVLPDNMDQGDSILVRFAQVENTVSLGPYFDGSTPDFSVDPDMRTRTLASGESVMEGQLVADYTGVGLLPILTADQSMRLILNSENNTAHAHFVMPEDARPGGTLLGTVNLNEPQVSPSATYARAMRVLNPNQHTSPAPNEAGSHDLRLDFGAMTSDYRTIFYHGGGTGSGDVIWTDIGLYAGTLPEDAEAFHNGDQWFRLEEIGGELLHVETLVWNGQDWVPRRMVADSVIVPSSVGTILLKDGAITAPKIKAGSIEFEHMSGGALDAFQITSPLFQSVATANRGIKWQGGTFTGYTNSGAIAFQLDSTQATITGGTIRTAASGQRIQLDSQGLRAFSASGSVIGNMRSDGTGFVVTGTAGEVGMYPSQGNSLQLNLVSSRRSTGDWERGGIYLTSNTFADGRGRVTSLDLFAGQSAQTANDATSISFDVSRTQSDNRSAGMSISNTDTFGILVSGPGGVGFGTLDVKADLLVWGRISTDNDVPWTTIALDSGVSGTLQYTRRLGILYIRGDITLSTALASGASRRVSGYGQVVSPWPTMPIPLSVVGGENASNSGNNFPAFGSVSHSQGQVTIRNDHSASVNRFQIYGFYITGD